MRKQKMRQNKTPKKKYERQRERTYQNKKLHIHKQIESTRLILQNPPEDPQKLEKWHREKPFRQSHISQLEAVLKQLDARRHDKREKR